MLNSFFSFHQITNKKNVCQQEVQIDFAALRTLADLGVDTEWISHAEAQSKDYGLTNALRHTHSLLSALERAQRSRLAAQHPALALAARAPRTEKEAARRVAVCLTGMAARVPPGALAPVSVLRKAMGVTLDHLDTPMPVDDFEDATEDFD